MKKIVLMFLCIAIAPVYFSRAMSESDKKIQEADVSLVYEDYFSCPGSSSESSSRVPSNYLEGDGESVKCNQCEKMFSENEVNKYDISQEPSETIEETPKVILTFEQQWLCVDCYNDCKPFIPQTNSDIKSYEASHTSDTTGNDSAKCHLL